MSKAWTICITMCLCLSFNKLCFGQQIEWQTLSQMQAPILKTDFKAVKKGTKGGKRVAASLFLFYKKYISSQDGMSCGFHPSCSEFAVNAIKRHGSKGVLMASDRLMRCNGISRHRYALDTLTGLRIDAVEK